MPARQTSPADRPQRPTPQVGLGRRLWPAVAIAAVSGGAFLALDRPQTLSATTGSSGAPPASPVATNAATSTDRPGDSRSTSRPNGAPSDSPSSSVDDSTVAGTPDGTDVTAPSQGDGEVDPAATPTRPAGSSECVGTVRQGVDADTRFGIVRVQATLTADGTLCNIDAIETPSENRRSVRINELAVPVLDERATSSQNTTFQAVSGATVTTDGYKQSLQSILDGR